MKLPHHIAGVSLGLALAACSGAQNGAASMTLPSAPGGGTHYPVGGAHKATTALIFVANENTGLGGTIREYAESANGNVAPSTIISHVGGPYAIAVSSSQGIGIANGNIDNPGGQSGAETFALNASGDAQPLTALDCLGKGQTNGVAFDRTGHLYVADASGRSKAIDVFAPGATDCMSPMRTIPDSGGLAIDSNNLLYVANSTTATIDIFPSGSGTMKARVGGSNTGLVAPGTVAVDASRNVYVFDTKTVTISEFAAGATGNVAPIRSISGPKTGLAGGNGFSFGLAVSKTSGEIFVSNPGSNAILGFAANASGNSTPIQTIAGSATGLSDPLGVALAE